MILKYLLVAMFSLVSCFLYAQQVNQGSPAAIRKAGKVKELMNALDWEGARAMSGKIVAKYPEWPEGWMILAEACQGSGDIKTSERALRKLVVLDSVNYPEAYCWISEWSFNRGDYREADTQMSKYFTFISDTNSLSFKVKLLRSSIQFALKELRNCRAEIPKKLIGQINTNNDEYFPSLSVDGSTLAFTRQTRSDSIHVPQEDLYYAILKDSVYGLPQAFPAPINTMGNEGTQSLSQDGRIMFFTACNRTDTKGGCDLYYCVRSGDRWSEPLNLGYPVNSRYWESTPFLATDGTRLFFASNRPGGYGGMDIWIATLKPDRSWSTPVNAGSMVNTPLDERSPVLYIDGKTLFFASNGHIGMGGFDLYKIDLTDTSPLNHPENLGCKVNTFGDEDALTVNVALNIGLFAAKRDSVSGKDIYQLDMSPYLPVKEAFTIAGKVKDKITGMPVGAKVEVQPHGESLASVAEADPISGTYLLAVPKRASYRVGAVYPGYLPFSCYLLNDTVQATSRIPYEIELEPIKTGATIVLQNIFFAFDSYDILPESARDLEALKQMIDQNPGIVLEISGYTDNIGTDSYNLLLSQQRAESVVHYLIGKGVNPNQLSAKGYGSSNPKSTNDTEEGRSLNRRTEVKVLRVR